MNLVELFALSFEALKERRLRASLTILMVVMGASLIVALNGTGNGFTNFINSQFSSLGANVLILNPRGENIDIDTEVANEISRIEGVDDVLLYIQQISGVNSMGKQQTAIVVGAEQEKLPLLFPTMDFQKGAFVSESDRIGVLLGNEVARSLGQNDMFPELGQTLKVTYQTYENQRPVVKEKTFVVRGVLDYIGSGIVPADQMIFISTYSAKDFFNRKDVFDGLYVILEDPDLNEEISEKIRDIYGTDFIIISPQMISDVIQQITGGVYMFINIVAMVSLLVASVGIITTLQTSVMERTKEIGLLKAIGFSRKLILSLFICEAMIIGIFGGAIGLFFGIGLSQAMTLFLGRSFQIQSGPPTGGGGFELQLDPVYDPWNLLFVWCLCITLSVASGFYPSWRASRLNPVVALRQE